MNEKLSALMDGELPREEAHTVIKTLGAKIEVVSAAQSVFHPSRGERGVATAVPGEQ